MPHTPKFEHDDFNDLELFETLDEMGMSYDPDGYDGDEDSLLDMVCMDLDDEEYEDEFRRMMDDAAFDDYDMDDEYPF
jgi:hypothetical protein